MSKSVLLVGCGDIGLHLGALLADKGFTVTGLKRSPLPEAPFEIVQADLLDQNTLSALQPQYDFIVYTATPAGGTLEAYQAIYIEGLKNLMAAVKPPKERLFLVSSTGVYHQSAAEWVDENSETEPKRFSGQVLLESEQLALAEWPNTTVLRFAGIYGPGRLRLVKKVQQGCSVIEEPPIYTNRIHRDDCVGMLAFLMEQSIAGAGLETVYIGVDDEPVTNAQVLDDLSSWLGLPLPDRETPEMGSEINQNKRCRNQKIKALGYKFQYPTYREGYKEILREEGLI